MEQEIIFLPPLSKILKSGKIYDDAITRQFMPKRNQLDMISLKYYEDESSSHIHQDLAKSSTQILNIVDYQKYIGEYVEDVEDAFINSISEENQSHYKTDKMSQDQVGGTYAHQANHVVEVQIDPSIHKKKTKANPKPKPKKQIKGLKKHKRISKIKPKAKCKKGCSRNRSNKKTGLLNKSTYQKHIHSNIWSQSWKLMLKIYHKQIITQDEKEYPGRKIILQEQITQENIHEVLFSKKKIQKIDQHNIESIFSPKSFMKDNSFLNLQDNLQITSAKAQIRKNFSTYIFFQFLRCKAIKNIGKFLLKLLIDILRRYYVIYMLKDGKMIDELQYIKTKSVLINYAKTKYLEWNFQNE